MCIQRDDVDLVFTLGFVPTQIRVISARALERLYYLDPSVFNTCGALQLWRLKERMERMMFNFASTEPAAFKHLVDRHCYNSLIIQAHGDAVQRDVVAQVMSVAQCMLQEG